MACDKKIVPGGSSTVFGGIDLFVGAVDPNAQYLYEYAASIGHAGDRWLIELRKVRRIWLAWEDGDGLHRLGLRIGRRRGGESGDDCVHVILLSARHLPTRLLPVAVP